MGTFKGLRILLVIHCATKTDYLAARERDFGFDFALLATFPAFALPVGLLADFLAVRAFFGAALLFS